MLMIKMFQEGDQVCVLLGENLQVGIAGFGDNVEKALKEFMKEIGECHQTLEDLEIDFGMKGESDGKG